MGQAKFVIELSKNNQFFFNLKAGNGEVILTSETYTSKQNCKNGILSVKNHATNDRNYEKKVASNGQYYFNLKATNGEIIGTSEIYKSMAGRDNGIQSVKDNAPVAIIEDKT